MSQITKTQRLFNFVKMAQDAMCRGEAPTNIIIDIAQDVGGAYKMKSELVENRFISRLRRIQSRYPNDVKAAIKATLELLIDINDGCFDCKEIEHVDMSPVPHYDPDTDGDYSAWLVLHNID
jgi:hypothetical protein